MHIDSHALALSLPRRISQSEGQGRGQGGARDGWQDGYEDAPSEAEGAALDSDETRGSNGASRARSPGGREGGVGGPSFFDTLTAHFAPSAARGPSAASFNAIAQCGTAAGPAYSTVEFAALAAASARPRRARGAYRAEEPEAAAPVGVDVAI